MALTRKRFPPARAIIERKSAPNFWPCTAAASIRRSACAIFWTPGWRLACPQTHKVVVVGTGRDYDPLEKRYGSHEQIVFTGLITDRGRLLEILRAADIFALPSMVEGLSLSMLEAMACGTAVIATDVGSDGEALGGAGLLVDPENLSTQLPLALDTLVRFPRFRQKLAGLARQRVEQRYSLDGTIQRMLELYEAARHDMQYGRSGLMSHDHPIGKVNLAS